MLKKESGFNNEELKKYKDLSNRILSINRYNNNYQNTIEAINSYIKYIDGQFDLFNSNSQIKLVDLKKSQLEDLILSKTNKQVLSFLQNGKKDFKQNIEELVIKIEQKLDKNNIRLKEIEALIKPYQQKVKNQDLLTKLSNELNEQIEKVKQIDKLDKEIQGVIKKGQESRAEIFKNYENLFISYKQINDELQKSDYCNIDKEIELKSSLNFNSQKFGQFTELFDNRVRLNNYFVRIFDENNQFSYDESTHLQAIELIFNELKLGENKNIKLKSTTRLEDLYYKLFDDYFKIDYKIIHKGDNILQMSPGKRGLVLLQLILHISNASHPILIDQPEDNLDNRTIYDELKQFIKYKKIKRQIIIVTHNANLVVSTDAENIIIANQSGQQLGKENGEFIFEYVSGAIENSFIDSNQVGILNQMGIKEHVCDLLEGGKDAFLKREMKYGFK